MSADPAELATAQEMLALYTEAVKRVSFGEEYIISSGGSMRRVNRGNAKELREEMSHWQREVQRLSGRRTRTRVAMPTDGDHRFRNYRQPRI